MKKIILILLLFVTITSNAQDNQLWFAFWDSDTTYIGFKDINGEIKIEPNLVGFTTAKKFDKIMAVIEDDDGNYKKLLFDKKKWKESRCRQSFYLLIMHLIVKVKASFGLWIRKPKW